MSEKRPIISSKRLQQTQGQVNEVVDIMRVNVDKVLERDKNLSELDGRADALQAGASQFEASAGKLKRKFWWQNCKLLLLLGTVITIMAITLIVWVISDQKAKATGASPLAILSNMTAFESGSEPGGEKGREALPAWSEAEKTSHTNDEFVLPQQQHHLFSSNTRRASVLHEKPTKKTGVVEESQHETQSRL